MMNKQRKIDLACLAYDNATTEVADYPSDSGVEAVIDFVEGLHPDNKWIDVRDALPKYNGEISTCILVDPPSRVYGSVDLPFAFYGRCFNNKEPCFHMYGRIVDVKYWMLIPDPPQQSK